MSCEHACRRPALFPWPVYNRPGLSEIGYRIGTYASLRGHMLARLDHQAALSAWTHRNADDPGIALIEAAALVGDILTFYQSLYANEAYLRTAQWRESVADLVRLLGYRLAPGLGGRACFAVAAKGERPITVPMGFGFKAQFEAEPKPAVFETEQALTAYPHLSRFHLYRPRTVPDIDNGMREFCVSGALSEGLELKAGDRIMVGVLRQPASGKPASGKPASGGEVLDASQVVIVDETWEAFGLRYVRMKGTLTDLAGLVPQLEAFKLSGSHRHFGHNAPATQVTVNSNGRAQESAVNFFRSLNKNQGSPANPQLATTVVPLDGEYDNVTAGTLVVIEASSITISRGANAARFTLVRSVRRAQKQTGAWGPMSGGSTWLTLEHSLALSEGLTQYADIRGMTIHTVVGQPFVLEATPIPTSGTGLDFFGTAEEAKVLEKRSILLAYPDGTLKPAQVSAVDPGVPKVLKKRSILLAYPDGTLKPAQVSAVDLGVPVEVAQPKFRRLTLDTVVKHADFGHEDPKVDVFGNLIEATQGKSEDEAVLGDGDGQQAFQTFPLPKAPLTYLLDATQTPSHKAELEIYVDGVKWQRADTFFSNGPDDRVYVVREDDKGKSYVQFGDGRTGARAPSGIGNVVGVYRTGIGAKGPLKADAKPQPAGNLPGLDQVRMPGPATGGAQPESQASARTAAPGRMQSLGRLVGLADYEAEALSVPGVIKARAVWAAPEGTPLIHVTLLTESGSAADANTVAEVLQGAHRSRGPARWPLIALPGGRRQVRLSLNVGYRAELREADVKKAVLEALGAAGEEANGIVADQGLFSWQMRQFGQSAHGSQVLGVVQNAPGVVWVELSVLGIVGVSSRRTIAGLPIPAAQHTLPCPDHLILALRAEDLTLNFSKVEA